MGGVAFAARGGRLVGTRRPSAHLQADFVHVNRLAGGQSVQNAAHHLAVAFAENRAFNNPPYAG